MADVKPVAKEEVKEEVVVAPKVEVPKLETVYLTTQFVTNDKTYGEPEREDENGELEVTAVEVEPMIAEDLRRRQREHDRVQRERFTGRTFKQMPNGSTVVDNSVQR